MTSNTTTAPGDQLLARRWFKEPMMWLVVGGPLVVVVASFVTMFIAVKYPDKVLPRNLDGTAQPTQAVVVEGQADALARSQLPALEARNHVVSPTLPKDR